MATPQDPTRALADVVDRLVAFEPQPEAPVLSLYLDARANERGRDQFEPFLRKELSERGRTFGASSRERQAFERDAQRIREWLGRELSPSADGVAVFACSEAGLFEATQLEVPVGESRLVVGSQPFVYPLVQAIERHPRYAALVADTNLARLFVFGLSTRLRAETEDQGPQGRRLVAAVGRGRHPDRGPDAARVGGRRGRYAAFPARPRERERRPARGEPARRDEAMSRRINVNPGQYKVAGRERQGEDVAAELEKQRLAQEQAARGRRRRGKGGAEARPETGGKGSGGAQK